MVADRNSAGRGEGGGGVAVCQRRGGGGREGEINNGEEGKGRKQRTRRGGGGSGRERERELSRIVRLWRDVQLVEDYYLSNRRFVGRGRKERRREGGWGGRVKGGADITSSIMVQLLLCTTYSRLWERGEGGGSAACARCATALWRTMFNHLCVDSFGFN